LRGFWFAERRAKLFPERIHLVMQNRILRILFFFTALAALAEEPFEVFVPDPSSALPMLRAKAMFGR
jgi:hypothetical protein